MAPRASQPNSDALQLPHLTTTVTTSRLVAAELLPSGRVLVALPDAALLWDPRAPGTPRRVQFAEDPFARGPFISAGNTRFVVVRHDGSEIFLDLWDAEALTKLETLAGSWKEADAHFGAFSTDRKRFLFVGCAGTSGRWSKCEASVYALPDGLLVNRVKLPPYEFAQYLPSALFSPTGKFYALSHALLPTEAHATRSGKLIYRVAERDEPYFNQSRSHCLFLDDRRMLSSVAHGGKLRVINLETGQRESGVDLNLKRNDFAHDHTLSSDQQRLALLIRHDEGDYEVAVWNVAQDLASRHLLPASLCPQYCELRWLNTHQLVVHAEDRATRNEWRLDAESDVATLADYVALPRFESGGFRVFGDNASVRSPQDPSTSQRDSGTESEPRPGASRVVTDLGREVLLPPLVATHAAFSVLGDELLVMTEKALYVVSRDGALSELVNVAP